MKFKKLFEDDIIIHPTINEGFIVKYRCTELVFTDYKTLIQTLNEFLKDPDDCIKEYIKAVDVDSIPSPTKPPKVVWRSDGIKLQ
uniref:Uncharacterized protein n=1 Tax=viral metagenome TaxID=1070528 RepID=A0A6M3KAX6_9ZZZZ